MKSFLLIILHLIYLITSDRYVDYIVRLTFSDEEFESSPKLKNLTILGRFPFDLGLVHVRHYSPDELNNASHVQHLNDHGFEQVSFHNVRKRMSPQLSVTKRASTMSEILNFNDKNSNSIWQFLDFKEEPLDVNVYPVWLKGITGKGVLISIMDDGLDTKHRDLADNIDSSASINLNFPEKFGSSPRGPKDVMPPDELHGTMCAGLVGSIANNSICSHGVAYGSKVAGIRMLDGPINDALEARSVNYALNKTHIYTASWGPSDDGAYFQPTGPLLTKAFEYGTSMGRNGSGSLYIFAAGNGRVFGDSCGADGFVNDPNVISVASIKESGEVDSYSEFCSAVRISVPVGEFNGIPTTTGNDKCYASFIGTSAACPFAAACFALALETNPNITYHDVMYITALSGRIPKKKMNLADFQYNGAGLLTSSIYGSGLLNCNLLVDLARGWQNTGSLCQASKSIGRPMNRQVWSKKMNQKQTNEMSKATLKQLQKMNKGFKVHHRGKTSIDVVVNENDIKGKCKKQCLVEDSDCSVERLETVSLEVYWIAALRGTLNFTLISPSGTESILLFNRPKDRGSSKNFQLFSSSQFYGESPLGKWRFIVHDNGHGVRGNKKRHVKAVIKGLNLIMRGTSTTESGLVKNEAILTKIMSEKSKEARKMEKAKFLSQDELSREYDWGMKVYMEKNL